jgi:uncharacterized protein (DUF488 family)
MQTPGFSEALRQVIDLARSTSTVLLCAEAIPWRCHRSLIADALELLGCRVIHMIDRGRSERHRTRREAVLEKGTVSYPEDPGQMRLAAWSDTDRSA